MPPQRGARPLWARLFGAGGLGRTLRGFSWMMFEKALGLIVALVVSIPLARYLGPERYGLWSYVTAVAAVAMPLSALGLDHIVTKEFVQNRQAEPAILGTVMALRKLASAVALLLVGIYVAWAPFPDDRLPLYIVLFVGASLIGNTAVLQKWFVAHDALRPYVIANSVKMLVFNGIRLVQIFVQASLTEFVILAAIESLCSGVVSYLVYRKVRGQPVKWTFDRQLAKKLLSRSWPLTISGLTAVVYLKLDVIMLAHLGSPAEAGVYAAAARLSEIWYFVPTLMMNAMFPVLLEVRGKSMELYNQRLQDVLDVFAAAGSMLAVAVALGAPLIVHLLYGPQFAGAAPVLAIHIWSGVFIFMRAALSKWLIAEDLYVFSLVTHGAGAAVNILLNIILIPKMGGMGAAIATLLSYASASYFALAFHPATRNMFWKMTKSLAWPLRAPELLQRLARHSRG